MLLEEGVCYDQCVLLENYISLCSALFHTPRPNLPVTPGNIICIGNIKILFLSSEALFSFFFPVPLITIFLSKKIYKHKLNVLHSVIEHKKRNVRKVFTKDVKFMLDIGERIVA